MVQLQEHETTGGTVSRRTSSASPTWIPACRPGPIGTAAALLILTQLALRGWASMGGWFYGDDYEFLYDAIRQPLSLNYLLSPHDSQFMPGGRLVAWIIAESGVFSWAVASLSLITIQAVASVACFWMLRTVFGPRPGILVLLALYLFSPLTITAFMWWSAAINQLPMQAAAFLATGAHVQYLRSRERRWLLMTAVVLLGGLGFYVKTVLVLIPLAVLTVTHFLDGSRGFARGTVDLLGRYRASVVLYGALAIGYVFYYTASVPSPISTESDVDFASLADTMFRVSLGPALVGGPWTWDDIATPAALVGTSDLVATVVLIGLSAAAVSLLRSRRSAWTGLMLAASYLVPIFVLTGLGRAAFVGDFAGLELRYLADASPFIVLGLGVATMDVPGALRRTVADRTTTVTPGPGRRTLAAASAAVLVGSVYSTVTYAGYWRSFPARDFVQTATENVEQEPLVILDEAVPAPVMLGWNYPNNTPGRMLFSLGDAVQASEAVTDPLLLDEQGRPDTPVVEGATSVDGPSSECGHPAPPGRTEVAMEDQNTEFFWWAAVSYLAGEPGSIQVRAGEASTRMEVEAGAHRFFFRGEGPVDSVSIVVPPGGPALCIDDVRVGTVRPLGFS